ncbi:MAG: InlB B-repeat-containing protein, partial [Woeseiaceae bacterium]
TGTGTVTSIPGGINCGATCQANFGDNTGVQLTAAADAGSTFATWGGDCLFAGTNPVCNINMGTAAKNVTATFNTTGGLNHTLSVTKDGTGTGTVTSNPAGIDCGATCQAQFADQTQVTLTAAADAGSNFVTWGDDCAGSGATPTCLVTMDQARNVTATFNTDGGGCQDDAFEINGSGDTDDTCYGTNLGALPAGPQTHLHCDEDWVYFNAVQGTTYRIETSNLVGLSDTTIALHDTCGPELIFNDDGGTEPLASAIEWTATATSDLDVRIRQFNDDYVPGKGYDISVSEVGGCPMDLNLTNQTITDTQTFIAQNQITTGPLFVVSATGNVTLNAGIAVVMTNDTSVAGQLTVNLPPNPCQVPQAIRIERRR